MRLLKRRDDPPAPRQRQTQPWSRRTILLSSGAAAFAVLALTGFVLQRTGVIARAGAAIEQRVFAMTAVTRLSRSAPGTPLILATNVRYSETVMSG